MKIRIPDVAGEEKYIEDKSSIILIGANGSGKTRMSVWIDENNPDINIHRISAQKSLNMPQMVSPTEMQVAKEEFLYGLTADNKDWLKSYGKKNSRWGNTPETYLLDDYQKLMQYLMTENYEKSIEYREKHKEGNENFNNETQLEKIKQIWENVILHRRLKICAGKIETSSRNHEDYYNGSEMSDGERAIFHFIGEVLCAPDNSLIIVDEPENHLHRSVLVSLWDAIETARTDCVFLYITHNLDFASSRVNAQTICVKEYFGNSRWEYDLVKDIHSDDSLKLQIMGTRQKILLCEGTSTSSIDIKLYSRVYREYELIPMGSCDAVIQATKAYNQTQNLHYAAVNGIVDRDRRDDEEIKKLKEDRVYVPQVAEIENLFLLPEVICIVADELDKDNKEEIIAATQEAVFDFLRTRCAEQALLFTKQKCRNAMIQQLDAHAASIEDYAENLKKIGSSFDVQTIYQQEVEKIKRILESNDYLAAVRVINHKGLLTHTRLPHQFGWDQSRYVDYVLRLLNKDNEVSERLRKAFKDHISDLE